MIEIDDKTLTEALNRVAATDDGKIVLACLKEYCVYDMDITGPTLEATYGNAILRRAYMYLRSRIRPEHLIKIEFQYKRSIDNGRTSTTDIGKRSDRAIGRRSTARASE